MGEEQRGAERGEVVVETCNTNEVTVSEWKKNNGGEGREWRRGGATFALFLAVSVLLRPLFLPSPDSLSDSKKKGWMDAWTGKILAHLKLGVGERENKLGC